MDKSDVDFQTKNFDLKVGRSYSRDGLKIVPLKIKDRYFKKRYAFEKKLFLTFTNTLEKHLRKRPHLDFAHGRNHVRRLVYLPPGVRAWAAYMPGGLATFSVHNPEVKHLASGKRVDYMTRALFRHSVDAQGLRSRAYTLTWRVAQKTSNSAKAFCWLSLASGSGQPVYDTVDSLSKVNFKVIITDHDESTLEFARQVYGIERPHVAQIDFKKLDVLKSNQLEKLLTEAKPDFIDAMGLFEYLHDDSAVRLLKRILNHLPDGGTLVFTNMSNSNPHLQLHKRGLGWPGVIPRSANQVAQLLKQAGVDLAQVTAYAPKDKVYNIFEIDK